MIARREISTLCLISATVWNLISKEESLVEQLIDAINHYENSTTSESVSLRQEHIAYLTVPGTTSGATSRIDPAVLSRARPNLVLTFSNYYDAEKMFIIDFSKAVLS